MAKLKIYQPKTILKLIRKREGETKFGEKITFISELSELEKISAEFVIFGIPEDIGVRANSGKAGAATAWAACLEALLNLQQNQFLDASNLILLGEIDCSEEMSKSTFLDVSDPNYYPKMGELVEKIDEAVSEIVKMIISAGKIPIIIGGGHNNAFGNIKGAAEALKSAINVLNIDAHTDLRKLEHRHSGNGFSFSLEKKFLSKYAIFGLHENYTPQYIFEEMGNSEEIKFSTFEEQLQSEKMKKFEEILGFVSSKKFGLEVDCDSIANFPSSAVSPSGFSIDDMRKMINLAAKEKNCIYLHLCEAMISDYFPTGKALGYFVTDFIKAKTNERKR